MGEKGYFQCQLCGSIHKEKIRFNKEQTYIKLPCPRCRGETKHLWVGKDKTDIYMYYNANLDSRYF